VKFLPSDSPDGKPTACGCDAVEFVYTPIQTLVFDPSTYMCVPCN
jgi:hypothetical protein